MTEEKTAAIYQAMAEVMSGLANIPKNGEMKFGSTNYTYLRAEDVQERINPLLIENSVIVSSSYSVDTLMRGRGEGSPYVYVNLELTYVSAEDGSQFGPVRSVGECAATDDKSINKALTQAIKNAHRATFQFASGELDPDDMKPGMVKEEAGPSKAEQKVAAAKTPTAPATGAVIPDEVKKLQAEIKAAADARREVEADFPTHMQFASKYLGNESQGWSKDVTKLKRVLAAIQGGETA